MSIFTLFKKNWRQRYSGFSPLFTFLKDEAPGLLAAKHLMNFYKVFRSKVAKLLNAMLKHLNLKTFVLISQAQLAK